GGPFTLLASTAANSTMYTDAGIAENSPFFYKVRAIASAKASVYSNVATAITLSHVVYENFNLDNAAASPWNNTNSLPEPYAVFENLKTDLGNPSGISISIVSDFSGYNPSGMITGNNSGVVPDNVMRSSYYGGKGVTARLRVNGLSQVHTYNFVFFASRDGSGDRTTIYTIGTDRVSLNASSNTTQTVQISGVRPDENGSIFIDITNGAASQYSYLNGLIIQAYNNPVSTTMGLANSLTSGTSATNGVMAPGRKAQEAENVNKTTVTVYPNPFIDNVTVQLQIPTKILLLSVKVTDISGRVISLQAFKEVPAGIWEQRISIKSRALKAGTYFIELNGLPGGKASVVKLIKVK
ncbi:MAG TPA: T9SS type A sorting domain-containing protein, partial [Niastella sp.]|nr:T9SS type A sorting domain-containing protein [Niastella sp.]